ncbi:MAG: hypothetical protein ABFD08_15425 [Syntrophomonas sp.]
MTPEQFSLMKELENIEQRQYEIEMEKSMLRGYILSGCPVMVPAEMAKGWMYTLVNQ